LRQKYHPKKALIAIGINTTVHKESLTDHPLLPVQGLPFVHDVKGTEVCRHSGHLCTSSPGHRPSGFAEHL
jgi:hypothetical protein